MNQTIPIRRSRRPAEEGYILVMVIFMLAILVLTLAIAAPRVKTDLQRDREIETMHRGKQYIRAIQLYYKRFGGYPPNVDALVKTNQIRFLRKKYIDPITGKDDWKPVLFGQNKAPMSMGMFGQAIGGSTIAGTGPSGGNGLTGGAGATVGSGLGSSSGSAFGSSSSAFGSSGSTFGSSGSTFGSTSSGDSSTAATGTTGNSSGTTTGTDANGNPTATSGSAFGSSGSAFGSSGIGGQTNGGQSFGGAGIIGVSPATAKQSLLVYKKKNHYNEWEFVYDPMADRMMQGGNTGAIGQPASSTTSPVGSSSFGGSSFGGSSSGGSSFGGSTFGNPGGSSFGGSTFGNPGGSSPTPPTTPAPPQ